MSGVVIGHAYEKRLRAGWGVRSFLAARLRRLAPLYVIGLFLGAGCALVAHRLGYAGDGPVALNLALGLAFVPALWGEGDLYPLNPPSWSLLDEILANLTFAAIASSLSDRTLKLTVGLGAVALILVTLRSSIAADLGVNAATFVGGLARVSLGFPLGVLLNRVHQRGAGPRWPLPAPLLLACAVATFVLPLDGPLYDLAVILALYPLLTAFALRNAPGSHRLGRWFGAAGALSYPLYILHDPPARLLQAVAPGGVAGAAITVVAGILFVLTAYAVARYVDVPVRRWLGQRTPRSVAV